MFTFLKRRLVTFLKFVSLILALKAVWIFYQSDDLPDQSGRLRKDDLISRKNFLVERIRSEDFGISDMTVSIPDKFKEEWLIGSLSMTTAAVTNIAFEYPETKAQALIDTGFMIDRMLKEDVRNYEKRAWEKDALENLDSKDGQIGYLGHLNFMLGAHRILGGDARYALLHRQISETLAGRLESSPAAYLETFPGQIFVPDNMVVFASLSLSNQIDPQRFNHLLERWQKHTFEHVTDPHTGLLLSWVDAKGNGIGPPRGSYLGWNIFYLSFFAPDTARQQYEKLKEHMAVSLPFGARAVREYPHGFPGSGDIDSGPVVFGLSTSGTGFAVSAARRFNDIDLLRGLLLTAEAVGSTVVISGRRRYLLAPFVGEAIMLAMKTARPWRQSI